MKLPREFLFFYYIIWLHGYYNLVKNLVSHHYFKKTVFTGSQNGFSLEAGCTANNQRQVKIIYLCWRAVSSLAATLI